MNDIGIVRDIRRKKIIILVVCLVLVNVIIVGILMWKNKENAIYKDAITNLDQHNYFEAISLFGRIKNYKDSHQKLQECHYQLGVSYLAEGNYDSAKSEFDQAESFKDAYVLANEAVYQRATAYLDAGNYDEAVQDYNSINEYRDAATMAMESQYMKANDMVELGQFDEACDIYTTLTGYKDVDSKLKKYMPVIQDGEIKDSWEEIIMTIDEGLAKRRYAIGATKSLDLGVLGTIHMQLAGFNLDERADGLGKVSTTWIALDMLPELQEMNHAESARGGWEESELRSYLKRIVQPEIPTIVRNSIVPVRKEQNPFRSEENRFTEDDLWIPDRTEVFGKKALYYDLFQNSKDKLIKTQDNSPAFWWLRSVLTNASFYIVRRNGKDGGAGANEMGGVVLCFCL